MAPDGSSARSLLREERLDDWQPIPVNAYPRPAGASPLRVSLVTAYDECTAPNRTHGPPLGFASCNPPTRTSDHLTVGTADSNGQVVRYEGHVRLNTIVGNPSTPGDQADVAIDFFSKGALTNGLANYTGELRAEVPLQITDKDNTPHPGGPGAATTQEFTFDIDATCAVVSDPSPHSECQTTTTADALIPGSIKEGRRSIWQLGQVIVYDGGADGDTATAPQHGVRPAGGVHPVRRAALLGFAVVCLLLSAPVAQAAFPGANGKLVFERSGDVWTANPDGSEATQLTSGAATDTGPRWSPDGKKIAFLRQTTGPFNLAIWVMNADGSNPAQILDCSDLPVTDCVVGEPAWSPDGSEIAWGFDDHCGWGGLWIADADGTNPGDAGCPGDRVNSDPAWSPDGEVIAIISNLGEAAGVPQRG